MLFAAVYEELLFPGTNSTHLGGGKSLGPQGGKWEFEANQREKPKIRIHFVAVSRKEQRLTFTAPSVAICL